MSLQPLTPPQDITWTRMAFSRDMMDTNFGDLVFGPKWRSSLAVFYYIVPPEDTADGYPNSRIVYLKLTSSITGYNPSEDLQAARTAAEEAGTLDDLQRTLWDVIISSGWAATYWPCLGAILQLGVYPNSPEGVAPDDYPFIMDFEPKKRELYEQVTQGSEFLAGSAEKLSTTKGSTNTQSVDVSGGGSFLGIGLSASTSATWQQVDSRTTDTSRENRETQSHSTSFSQMYQLFNGYHLGTNRALFVVAPRPHTVSESSQTDFNLIDGQRRLEGLQEVFLVVNMPKSLDGFCIQAGLDTGHQVTVSTARHLVMMAPVHQPNGGPDPGGGGGGTGGGGGDGDAPVKQLVVTRRVVQACGTFDENGEYHLRQVSEPRPPIVVGEIGVLGLPTSSMFRLAATAGGADGRDLRVQVADNLNMLQSNITRGMLNAASAAEYKPRPFEQTDIFTSLAASAATSVEVPLGSLVAAGFLSRREAQQLERNKILSLADLYAQAPSGSDANAIQATRMDLMRRLLARHQG
jgi:hypothetical protein